MAAGIRIAPYQPLGVRTPAVPGGGYQQIDTRGIDFGQGLGRGLQQAGADVQQGAKELQVYLKQEKAKDDEAVVKEADAAFNGLIRKSLFDPKEGYFTTRGLAAGDRATPTLEGLEKLRDEAVSKLGNDEQRRLFRDLAQRRLDMAGDQVFRHSLVERQRGHDQASASRITSFVSDAAAYGTDDNVLAASIHGIAGTVRDDARRHGWDDATTKAKIRDEVTKAIVAQIDSNLDTNPGRARMLLSRFAPQMDGVIASKLDKQVRDAEVRRGSQDDADRIREGRQSVRVTPGVVEGDPRAIPAQYADTVKAAASKHNVPIELLAGLLYNESRYKADARNPGDQRGTINPKTGKPYDSLGIAQFGEQWAAGMGFDPLNANASINAAAKVLSDHATKYNGNWALARLAYGMGAGNVDKWLAAGGDPAKLDINVQEWIGSAMTGKTGRAAIEATRAMGPKLAGAPSPAAVDLNKKPPIDPETNKPTLEWQLEQARTIGDPERREAVIARLRSQHGADRAQVTDRQNRAADAATAWLDGNPGRPVEDMPAAIWEGLTPKAREAAREYAKKAGKVETDIGVWYALKQMATSTDPDVRRQFATTNPLQWRAVLNDSTIKEVVGWQETIKKGDQAALTEVVSVNEQVKTYARILGLDTSPKDNETEKVKALAEFHMAAQREFNAVEKATGKKLDADGREAILKRMALPVDLGTSFLGMGGTSPRYKVQRIDQLSSTNRAQIAPWHAAIEKEGGGKPTEADLLAGFGAAKNYGVPMNEVPTAIAILKRNRVTVTDDAIGKYWLLEKQRRAGGSRPTAPTR